MPATPLQSEHERCGARLIEFHGWRLPVLYTGIIEEHRATRTAAGLFDVSHLTRVLVTGADALPFLQRLMTNDLEIARVGKVVYSLVCNEQGGVLDDCYVYPYGRRRYLVILNAATAAKDLQWLQRFHEGDVTIEDITIRTGGLALQGPQAVGIAEAVLGSEVTGLGYREFKDIDWHGTSIVISATGYTGESGVECFGPSSAIVALWGAFLQSGRSAGLVPVGLGARDTLRLEMGYGLYGVDLDEARTPFEAGLERAVNFGKPSFIGREALLAKQRDGATERLVGLVMIDQGIARHGCMIEQEGRAIGVVTSGTQSPSLDKSIALGYVPTALAAPGTRVEVVVHGRRCRAEVARLPFYRRSKLERRTHVGA